MHLALVRGELAPGEAMLVRMHSHCVLGDVFGSRACECRANLDGSLRQIAEEGRGVLVYLHQTAPGLRFKDGAIETHGRGPSFAASDSPYVQHEIGIGAQILIDLGHQPYPPADESSTQNRRAGGLWRASRRAGPDSLSPVQ